MKRSLLLSVAVAAMIAGATFGRGFGGGFGGGGFHGGGFSDAGRFNGGDFNRGGFADHFGSANNSGIGGMYGGDGIRGAGGLAGDGIGGAGGMAGDGFRGAGGFDGMNRQGLGNLGIQSGGFGAGQFGPPPGANRGFNSMAGMRPESMPSAEHLNSFLGLPTDMGMRQASGEHAYGYTGSARGLSAYNPGAAGGGQRDASGHIWTGPNGTDVAHGSVGERGAVVGPNGGASGERGARGTVVKGPDGNTVAHGSAGERGAVVGPNGAAAGSRSVSGTAVRGANGNVAARSSVTRTWSAADLRVQGNSVRANFNHYDTFNHDWYHDHPNAWIAAGFKDGIWAHANWSNVTGWFNNDWPVYGYMYGNDLTYEGNNVCLYGQPIATAADYYQSAANIVQTGEQAQVASLPASQYTGQTASDSSQAKWLPLGVFQAVPATEKTSNMMFQLAVNKAGIVRGNYYDTTDQNVQLIEGSVDKDAQRVAWVVADKKNIIFDCGLYNLTKDETPVLVHMGKDKNEQWTFVRLKPKAEDAEK